MSTGDAYGITGAVEIEVGFVGGPFDGMRQTVLLIGDRLPAEGRLPMSGERTVAVYEPFLKSKSKRIAFRFVRVEAKTDDDEIDADAGQ